MRTWGRFGSAVLSLVICVGMGSVFTSSCTVKPINNANGSISQVDNENTERTVTFQPIKPDKGKRCAARVFANVGKDDDFDPECYALQLRLVKGAEKGDLAEITKALKDGAHPNGSVFNQLYPPLYTAVDSGQSDAVCFLLDNGANINQGSWFVGTPLFVAARTGQTEILKILLERGADVCLQADGGTAEDFARNGGYTEIVELLKTARKVHCK
jgi:ankyrin repeat protein